MDSGMSVELDVLNAAIESVRAEAQAIAQKVDQLGELVAQLGRRQMIYLEDRFVAVRSDLGWLVIPQEEQWLLIHFANGTGLHEPGTIGVLQALIREGDTVIDVGAHIGLLSLPMATAVGSSGSVVLLEPAPRSAECLRRTIASNGLDARARVIEAAVSDEDGLVEYFPGVNSMMGTLVPGGHVGAPQSVKSVSLDHLLPPGMAVDLVKIDAEGYEIKVLRGMTRVIAENRDIFVIAEFGPYHLEKFGIDVGAWFNAFFKLGLRQFLKIDEVTGRCFKVTIDQLVESIAAGGSPSCNLIFFRASNRKRKLLAPLTVSSGSQAR